MKAKELIILLFPASDRDEEVIDGGIALFTRHIGRNLLKLRDPGSDKDDLLGQLATARESAQEDHAEHAWLIQVHHKTKDFSGEVSAGNHYNVLDATAPLPHEFAGDSVGVYVVAHCDHGIVEVFGHYGMGQGDHGERVTDTATKLVSFFTKLGLRSVRKLCLVACNTVPSNGGQKDTLEQLVLKLHENEMHPLIAGWDIPIVVETNKESRNYGRKKRQTEETMAADLRKQHKFVYKYEVVRGTFDMKKEKAAHEGEVLSQFNRVTKKEDYVKHKQILGTAKPVFTKNDKDGQKTKITWSMEFARRMKYTHANWSHGV